MLVVVYPGAVTILLKVSCIEMELCSLNTPRLKNEEAGLKGRRYEIPAFAALGILRLRTQTSYGGRV